MSAECPKCELDLLYKEDGTFFCPVCECQSCAALCARIEDTEGMGKAMYEATRLEDMPDWGTDNYLDADYMSLALAVQKFLKGE